MSSQNLIEKVRAAGVVGAGGAGFPTAIKLQKKIETLIINGAECEPLLHKDKELMKNFAIEIMTGVEIVREFLEARKAIIGIKFKNTDEIKALKRQADFRTEFCLMGDVYPAGDEFVLVYEATGKLIPPAGIPLDIGCVVLNCETALNIANAVNGIPVTEKMLTVAGAVNNPLTFMAPIGITYSECIAAAGGATVSEYAILSGGAMMGELITDLSTPITKTTAGLIILPLEHQLIKRRMLPPKAVKRIGASACDQCFRCTELCPRWLLGYDIVPHEVMRSLLFGPGERKEYYNEKAMLCIECNVCSLYACPEDLDPKNICTMGKQEMYAKGNRPDKTREVKANPIRSGRQVPTRMLTRKLGLAKYDIPAPYTKIMLEPSEISIPLKQHSGTPATATVAAGQRVSKGDLIGRIEDGVPGANVHTSIDGIVENVGNSVVIRKA